jgi:hypothetical protein
MMNALSKLFLMPSSCATGRIDVVDLIQHLRSGFDTDFFEVYFPSVNISI